MTQAGTLHELTKRIKADLCRKKPDPKVLDLGDTTVVVTVTVTAKKEIPPILMKRMVDLAAVPVMREYQRTIEREVVTLETKVKKAMAAGDKAGAEALAQGTTASIKNACDALQAAVNAAVAKQLKTDAHDDQILLDAQIKVGIAISFKVIHITLDATRIGLTMGADVHAIVMLCKHSYELAKIVYDLTKDEPKLRAELLKAIGDYTTGRQRKEIDKIKAKKSNLKLMEKTLKDAYGWLSPKAKAAETARKRYKNQVTKMRQGLEDLSLTAHELNKKIKSGVEIKNAEKLRTKAKLLDQNVQATYKNVRNCEQFAADMAMLLAEAFGEYKSSAKVTDLTWKESMNEVKMATDFASACKLLWELASEINDLAA